MRTFTMYRREDITETHDANQANAPDQPQFQGVEFDDGTVAIRWLTAKGSTSVWASMEDMLAIHGHPEYGSQLVWGHPRWELGERALETVDHIVRHADGEWPEPCDPVDCARRVRR